MSFNGHLDKSASDKVKAAAARRGIPFEQSIAAATEPFVAAQDVCEVDWTLQHAADFSDAQAQFARGEGIPHDLVMATARARLRSR